MGNLTKAETLETEKHDPRVEDEGVGDVPSRAPEEGEDNVEVDDLVLDWQDHGEGEDDGRGDAGAEEGEGAPEPLADGGQLLEDGRSGDILDSRGPHHVVAGDVLQKGRCREKGGGQLHARQ